MILAVNGIIFGISAIGSGALWLLKRI